MGYCGKYDAFKKFISRKVNMSNSWYDIKIDVSNALNPNFKWPTPSKSPDRETWGYNPETILSKEWIEFTRSLGLEWGFVQIFWKRANLVHDTAHLDVFDGDTTKAWPFALNWTMRGGEDSIMLWYHLPENNFTVKYSSANTPYADWKISELTECDRHNVGKNLTLVRTGIPHDVNTGTQERWCVSARLRNVSEVTWDQIVADFRKKNLLVERNNE